MRSRGLDFKTAHLLLIDGFAKEALKIISEKNINQYVNEQLSYWLENTGVT
jgi:Fe-S cluster assembly scaffold protein SufB